MPAPVLIKKCLYGEVDWAYEETPKPVEALKHSPLRVRLGSGWPASFPPVLRPRLDDGTATLLINGRPVEDPDSILKVDEDRLVVPDARDVNVVSLRVRGKGGRQSIVYIYPKYIPDEADWAEIYSDWYDVRAARVIHRPPDRPGR